MIINFNIAIFAAVFLLFSLVNCSLNSNEPGLALIGGDEFGLHSGESKTRDEEGTSALNAPLINAENGPGEAIETFDWNANVPVGRIRAGTWILSVIFLFKFVIKSTGVLSIIAELGLSGALIYLLQSYFGYYIRLWPMGLEEFQYSAEDGFTTFSCWALLVPSTWLNLSAYLYLPGHIMHPFFPMFISIFIPQVLMILLTCLVHYFPQSNVPITSRV